jgi:hypothetical protein
MESATNEKLKNMEKEDIILYLGDIIEIEAPSNKELHNNTYFITYIDNTKIKIADIAIYDQYILHLTESGTFTDETITQINLLSRSDDRGYAKQNGLLLHTWLDVHFNGEIPFSITGEITDAQEDMIEITTFPGLEVIYIDFEYKGIPENIPIDEIVIRDKPASAGGIDSLTNIVMEDLMDEEGLLKNMDEGDIEYTEDGEMIIKDTEQEPTENVRTRLHQMYQSAIGENDVFIGEDLEEIAQTVEIPEHEKRYSIDVQTKSFMDHLLADIPNHLRNQHVMANIHTIIERYRELREVFSKYDGNGNIHGARIQGAYYKPLVDHLKKMDVKLNWIVPVVSIQKKVYDVNDATLANDVETFSLGDQLKNQLQIQDETYFQNKMKMTDVKYENMYQQITPFFTPFDPLPPTTIEHAPIANIEIDTDIEGIVDNLNDLYSTTVVTTSGKDGGARIHNYRFANQRYITGMTDMKLETTKSGKHTFIRDTITPNDTLSLRSMITLPQSVMNFSRISLPTTNIMERSQLHMDYFTSDRIMKKNTKIDPYFIDDLTKEIEWENDGDNDENPEKPAFLSKITQFILTEDEVIRADTFDKYLNVIIPKTRTLIRNTRKYIRDKMSFIDVVHYLEPFMVYTEDITYKQQGDIRWFIKEKIKEYKKKFVTDFQQFDQLKKMKFPNISRNSEIARLLTENPELNNTFRDLYNISVNSSSKDVDTNTNIEWTSSELLFKILVSDDSYLFVNLLSAMMYSLRMPDAIADRFNESFMGEMDDIDKIKAKDCMKRFLTKKYTKIADLQKDNNHLDVFYDKEYDDTPYSIMDNYKNKRKEMTPEVFKEFIKTVLVEKHDCPPNDVDEMTETLISGKKRVKNGEYAIFEDCPVMEDKDKESMSEEIKRIHYYKRVKDNWVKDADINENSFLNTNDIFCNVSQQCYRNTKLQKCESVDVSEIQMKEKMRNGLLKEFDQRYHLSTEELKNQIMINLNERMVKLTRLERLRDALLYKNSRYRYMLGENSYSEDLIISPHSKLLDMIIGRPDFVEKQLYIVLFYETFCREPIVDSNDEDPQWKYCKDTNTKLLPAFLYILAETYMTGGNYEQVMAELCANAGISEDGDAFIDKSSGRVIRKIDYVTEDVYEDGFRMVTHDIMEKDLGAVITDKLRKIKDRVFENETTEFIYRVFVFLCENVAIDMNSIEDFVMRISLTIVEKNVMKEAAYEYMRAERLKKNGKEMPSYNKYRDESIIFIVTGVLLTSIQTAIPGFQSRKTFPGCLRSFSGYPMTGEEDLTGIEYLACILEKTRSAIRPWSAIQKLNAKMIKERLKKVITMQLMSRIDIIEKYTLKREYLLIHPDEVIPESHSIQRWFQFLPPVVPIDIVHKIQPISVKEMSSELLEMFQKGNRKQIEQMFRIKSQGIRFTIGLVEMINDIVSKQGGILKTSANVPFLENACCNDSKMLSPVRYFNDKNGKIAEYIETGKQITQVLHSYWEISRAPFFYHPKFTGFVYPTPPIEYLEKDVYLAFIHYCNLDNLQPIPEEFHGIITKKLDDYNPNSSIEEKIETLKRHGKQFTMGNLQNLMNIVEQRNIVHIAPPSAYNVKTVFSDVLESFRQKKSTVIEEPLVRLLMTVVSKYEPGRMVAEESDEIRKLNSYLSKTNAEIYANIMNFIDVFGNLNKSEFETMAAFLENVDEWSDMASSSTIDANVFKKYQYIKNVVMNMSKLYPSLIVNCVEQTRVPKHWDLSKYHTMDVTGIIKKYYRNIGEFTKDKVLDELCMEIQSRLSDICLFIENVPFELPMVKEKQSYYSFFPELTLNRLMVYSFYSCIYEYIVLSNDAELLRTDVMSRKMERRETIRENRDYAQSISGGGGKDYTLDISAMIDEIEDLEDVQIEVGNREEFKTRVCSVLLLFLTIEMENKKQTDYSYKNIMEKVHRTREKEKNKITANLESMSIEERKKVEEVFKKYKIGKWNKGEQKGLYQYDKHTYDNEREEIMEGLFGDENGGISTQKGDAVDEMWKDIYDIEKEDEAEADAEIEQEYGIDGLGEDYMDGNYYEEDNVDDF